MAQTGAFTRVTSTILTSSTKPGRGSRRSVRHGVRRFGVRYAVHGVQTRESRGATVLRRMRKRAGMVVFRMQCRERTGREVLRQVRCEAEGSRESTVESRE